VYLTEISNGAYEAIYIIVLVYLTEKSKLHMLHLISQLGTPGQ
jgi:hypothetical protein